MSKTKEVIVNINDDLKLVAYYEGNEFIGLKTVDGDRIPHWDGRMGFQSYQVLFYLGEGRWFEIPKTIDDEVEVIDPAKVQEQLW